MVKDRFKRSFLSEIFEISFSFRSLSLNEGIRYVRCPSPTIEKMALPYEVVVVIVLEDGAIQNTECLRDPYWAIAI